MLHDKTFFVGLGAPKCGTSWLSDYLNAHPEVLMPPIWELRFFKAIPARSKAKMAKSAGPFLKQLETLSARLAKNFGRDKKRNLQLNEIEGLIDRLRMFDGNEAYLEMFRKRIGPLHRAFGEQSPVYCSLGESGFAAIRAMHNPVRVIFIMRDPVDRHWSHMWYQLVPKAKKSPDQLAADTEVRNDPAAITGHLAKTLSTTLIKRGRYDLTLQAMDRVFEPEQMLVLFYEDLFTEASIARLTDFLGISARPAQFDKRVNSNSKKENLSAGNAAMIRETYSPVYEYCSQRFGTALPASWRV